MIIAHLYALAGFELYLHDETFIIILTSRFLNE